MHLCRASCRPDGMAGVKERCGNIIYMNCRSRLLYLRSFVPISPRVRQTLLGRAEDRNYGKWRASYDGGKERKEKEDHGQAG